jgi:hypothetical protein
MNAIFSYIKEHLDGNYEAIWELGEQCSHYSWKN